MKSSFPFVLLLLFPLLALADQCPTPKQIRERSISRDYDWSVGETVTLDMLLEISELRKVSLYNNGEFISCHYISGGLPVRMDGTAVAPECLVTSAAGEWLPLAGGELGCVEDDLANCRFHIECHE